MYRLLNFSEKNIILRAVENYYNNNSVASQRDAINNVNILLKNAVTLEIDANVNRSKLHSTEQKYPEQCKMFREIIEKMYETHLKKNADYSPYNIKVTGMRGLVTRLWDKSARFFSLMGLDIGTGEWNDAKVPENESIEDNVIDWANYCIITRIFLAGKWGK